MKNWKFYAKYIQENPAYSGIHDKEQSKKRRKKMRKFKKKYGFEYSDIWNFDHTLAAFILPRLAYFRDIHHGFPCRGEDIDENGKIINEEKIASEYQKKLDTMVEGFYLYLSKDYHSMTEEEEETWKLARQYLAEEWEGLWD